MLFVVPHVLFALESVDVPNIRQVGIFDPVAQMLSRSSLRGAGARGRNSSKKGGAEETSSPAKTRLLRRPAIIQQEMDMPEDLRIPPWPRLRGVHHRRDRPKKNSSSSVGFMLPPHSEGDARRVSSCEEHTKSSRRQSHVKVLQRGKCIQATTAFCESRLHIASRQAGSFRVRSFRGTFAQLSSVGSCPCWDEPMEDPNGHGGHGSGASGSNGAYGVTNGNGMSNGYGRYEAMYEEPGFNAFLPYYQENVSNLANATYMQHVGQPGLSEYGGLSGISRQLPPSAEQQVKWWVHKFDEHWLWHWPSWRSLVQQVCVKCGKWYRTLRQDRAIEEQPRCSREIEVPQGLHP
eukprot:s713_g19.t3